jgi:hypothetical protein
MRGQGIIGNGNTKIKATRIIEGIGDRIVDIIVSNGGL